MLYLLQRAPSLAATHLVLVRLTDTRMKRFIAVLLLISNISLAGQGSWNPADASRDAERDIHRGKIGFCWHGTYGAMPVGVPLWLAERYPHINAGAGCTVTDWTLFERQGKYAGLYNARMLAYVQRKR
jgi:hypothetical protein